MKISRIETIPIRVPIKPELAIRSGRGGSHIESPFLLVKVHTDEGTIGLGEVSCTPRWSGEDQVTAGHFIEKYFAPGLVGEVVDDVGRLNAKFNTAVAGNYFTKAGVEMALWDIVGKAQGKPVYELLRAVPACSLLAPRRSLLRRSHEVVCLRRRAGQSSGDCLLGCCARLYENESEGWD